MIFLNAGGRKVGVICFFFFVLFFFGLDMELTMGIEENDEWIEFDNGVDMKWILDTMFTSTLDLPSIFG